MIFFRKIKLTNRLDFENDLAVDDDIRGVSPDIFIPVDKGKYLLKLKRDTVVFQFDDKRALAGAFRKAGAEGIISICLN